MSEIKRCENCKFWRLGTIGPKGIGNAGNCVVLMPQTLGFYDKNPTTPFWAQDLSHQTTSWEGEGCPAHQFVTAEDVQQQLMDEQSRRASMDEAVKRKDYAYRILPESKKGKRKAR